MKSRPELTPVLIVMTITDPDDNFILNRSKFSAFYATEGEVILQDGIQFKIEQPLAKAAPSKTQIESTDNGKNQKLSDIMLHLKLR